VAGRLFLAVLFVTLSRTSLDHMGEHVIVSREAAGAIKAANAR
jgi:hypothetical protein